MVRGKWREMDGERSIESWMERDGWREVDGERGIEKVGWR
jgi:hypothetical protein